MEIKPTLTGISKETRDSSLASEKKPSEANMETSRSTSSSDSFTLTDTAASIVRLEEKLAQVPEIDNQRVQAIKQAIESGSYSIDTSALVDNLLKAEKEIH